MLVLFRTGPIRNFTPAEITVVACVLAVEEPDPADHDITFTVVSFDRTPVVLHSENTVVKSGGMVEFEATLTRNVRSWEVRVEADLDPELLFVTIYHLLDGQTDPNLTFRAGELYYVDESDNELNADDTADFFMDIAPPFLGEWDLPPNWLHDGEDDNHQPWG